MKKEFNLSEKIVDDLRGGGQLGLCIEDVKQFIEDLIIWIGENRYLCNHEKVVESEALIEFIEQKAGDKLKQRKE